MRNPHITGEDRKKCYKAGWNPDDEDVPEAWFYRPMRVTREQLTDTVHDSRPLEKRFFWISDTERLYLPPHLDSTVRLSPERHGSDIESE